MLRNMKVSQNLSVGFGLIIIMLILIATLSIYNMAQIQTR